MIVERPKLANSISYWVFQLTVPCYYITCYNIVETEVVYMDSKLIGKYLQQKRKFKDMTQKELADILGVTFQAVSRWEKGDSIPDLDSLDNLAKFYNVSIDKVLQRGSIFESEGLPTNFRYLITMIVSFAYLIGGILFAMLLGVNIDPSWAYLANIMFMIAGLFLHNMFLLVNKKNKSLYIWYGLTYIPLLVALIFFFLIESGIID